MQTADPVFHKPKSIIAAKNIFYACLFIGLSNVILRDVSLGITNNGGVLGLIISVAGFTLIIYLIKQITLRKEWARTVLLVITFIMLISIRFVFQAASNVGTLEKTLFIFRQVLQIIGFIFLYQKESNAWFNAEYRH